MPHLHKRGRKIRALREGRGKLKVMAAKRQGAHREPTDFGRRKLGAAPVTVTNVCNLECRHGFVY